MPVRVNTKVIVKLMCCTKKSLANFDRNCDILYACDKSSIFTYIIYKPSSILLMKAKCNSEAELNWVEFEQWFELV